MGSSESKIAVEPKEASTPKPDPAQIQRLRNDRVNRLLDPRSPSTDIDRTPIQIGGAVIRTSVGDRVSALSASDPRSPSVGITRTPIKGTVGSLAHRLGMLFLGDSLSCKPSEPSSQEEVVAGDQGSSEALQPFQASETDGSSSSGLPSLRSACSYAPSVQSQLVHLAEAEVEVEVEAEVEVDLTYEEAEEAKESPLHKRLSMSLITCHEGAVPTQVLADIHHAYPSSLSHADVEPHADGPEHSYALPSITFDLMSHVTPSQPAVVAVANVTEWPEELVEAEPVEMPSVGAEPVAVMSVEVESVEVAPAEAESVAVILVEEESVEVASVEEEPVKIAPVEAEPVVVTSVEAEPVEAAPVEAEPVVLMSVEAEPVVVTSVEAEPVEAAPVEAEPVVLMSVEAEPVVVTSVEAEHVEVAPVEAEPVELALVEAETVKVASVEAEPVAVMSVEAEPVELAPVEAEPVEVAPVEAEPVEVTSVEAEPIEQTQDGTPGPDLTLQPPTGIRCPVFDAKSPSQVVFKPQWLGKGFGTTGVRARGKGGRGPSSPLSVRTGTKKSANENRAPSKQKQRGKALAEGRSPLQILKETNSPRDHHSQTKLKVSTPDRQRAGHLDRRVLTTSLEKENR